MHLGNTAAIQESTASVIGSHGRSVWASLANKETKKKKQIRSFFMSGTGTGLCAITNVFQYCSRGSNAQLLLICTGWSSAWKY
jgi:hypothetical protein